MRRAARRGNQPEPASPFACLPHVARAGPPAGSGDTDKGDGRWRSNKPADPLPARPALPAGACRRGGVLGAYSVRGHPILEGKAGAS
jgi:hypothetical protein